MRMENTFHKIPDRKWWVMLVVVVNMGRVFIRWIWGIFWVLGGCVWPLTKVMQLAIRRKSALKKTLSQTKDYLE